MERALQGDYREPDGTIHRPLGGGAEVANQWHHIALVKDTQTQAPAHIYHAYVDGVKTLSTVDGHPNEPDPDLMWTISGRVGAQFTGLLDEVRLTQRALAPCDFLISASPCSSPTPTPTATGTPSSTPSPSPSPRQQQQERHPQHRAPAPRQQQQGDLHQRRDFTQHQDRARRPRRVLFRTASDLKSLEGHPLDDKEPPIVRGKPGGWGC